jgi:hypothetical protein
MPVHNIMPGNNLYIPPGTVPGSLHIYVKGPGAYARYNVQVDGGPNWTYMRPVGDTERVVVNNQDVTIGNSGPCTIQVLIATAGKQLPKGKTELAVLDGVSAEESRLVGNAAEEAMKTLTAQWYNAVVTGCTLNAMNFQLYQAHLPLGNLSANLWSIFDAVPPFSIVHYYNPSQLNILSQNYGAVVNHLNPQNGDKFQTAMGDYYPQWASYLKTNPKIPTGGMLALFQAWAQMNMPPDQAQTCYTLYAQLANDTIVDAVDKWISMQTATSHPGIAAYSQTIEDLKHALAGAPPATFTLNSETESSDISNTWAKTEVGGLLDFFWGGGDTQYQKWTEQVTSSGVTIAVTFDKLVTFAAGPLYQPSTDPILSQYTPWYNGKALSIGYHHNDNTVWQHGAPTWADTFGPNGDLQRCAVALIVVDGISVTTQSSASIAKSEQEDFTAAAAAGFFPFFEAEGSGGWSHTTTFNDNGSFSIASECPQGNPQVIGVLVSDIASIFSVATVPAGRSVPAAAPRPAQPVGRR